MDILLEEPIADAGLSDLQLSDGITNVTAYFLNQSEFWFDVKGTAETINQAGKAVAWVVGALRNSNHETGTMIRPEVSKRFYDGDWKALYINYTSLPSWNSRQSQTSHSPATPNGRYWQAMFRNPVVVSGFPILPRPQNLEHSGLEMSLDMMACLVQASRLTQYAGRQYLKGFSSMLVAVQKTKGIVLWHHHFSPSGDRISYLAAEAGSSSDLQQISLEDILSARHIIGWCSHARFGACRSHSYG